jgi:tetratricopeptide (TPR) repeat protein
VVLAAVGAALAAGAPLLARAQGQKYLEPGLVAMLPPYCKYTQDFRARLPEGNNPLEIERWTAVMGATFNHMHHYCYGLMDTNRASFASKTPEQRRYQLSISINEFDYVIQRAPAEFPLLPEILTRKGENLIRLERGEEGLIDLRRAIEIQADYSPAYAAISDFYKDSGRTAKAREWLEKGVAAAPNSHALTRRLAELDAAKGKPKTVQPRADR